MLHTVIVYFRFVTLVPMWIAPNLITMAGLMVNIITSLVLVMYCPTATEMAPWWTTFSCALGLFIYQTLDAIDGKQARRTKTSSPLGELFDHGCDSMSTVFVSIASCCAVRLGMYPGWMLFQVIFIIFFIMTMTFTLSSVCVPRPCSTALTGRPTSRGPSPSEPST